MSMVNRMRLVEITICLATIALSVPAEAGPILRVKNVGVSSATLSDLIAYGEADQKNTILKLNDASDNIVLPLGETATFDAGFEVKKYFISRTATGIGEFETGVFEVKQSKPTPLGFVRDPNQLVDLFAFIDFDLALPPPPEGTLLSFVDGQNPAVPGWFVGTVVDLDNGTVSGAYDGVGQILAGFEVEAIAAIPEPSTLILFGAGAAAFGAYRWRHSRRKTASPPTSASKSFLTRATLISVAITASAQAAPVTIDFEAFPLGATVSGAGVFPVVTFSSDVPIYVVSANPGPNFGGLNAAIGQPPVHPLPYRADFASVASFISVVLGDYNADADDLFLQAYDASNTLLDSDAFALPGPTYGGPTLSVSGANIAYILLGSTGVFDNSVYFDNFTYDVAVSAVPEPASLALFSLGLSALFLMTRRIGSQGQPTRMSNRCRASYDPTPTLTRSRTA